MRITTTLLQSNAVVPLCLMGRCWGAQWPSSASAASVGSMMENPCIYWGGKSRPSTQTSDGRKPIPNSRSPSSDTLRQLFAGWQSNEERSRWRGEAADKEMVWTRPPRRGLVLITSSSQHARLFRAQPCVCLFVWLIVFSFVDRKGAETSKQPFVWK